MKKLAESKPMGAAVRASPPIPVRVTKRAQFWIVPSRTQPTPRFVVVFSLQRQRRSVCSCPSRVMCYHIQGVNRELRKEASQTFKSPGTPVKKRQAKRLAKR